MDKVRLLFANNHAWFWTFILLLVLSIHLLINNFSVFTQLLPLFILFSAAFISQGWNEGRYIFRGIALLCVSWYMAYALFGLEAALFITSILFFLVFLV